MREERGTALLFLVKAACKCLKARITEADAQQEITSVNAACACPAGGEKIPKQEPNKRLLR